MAPKPGRRDHRAPRRRAVPHRSSRPAEENPEDLELFRDMRAALRSDDPLDLLMGASSLLSAVDPRSADPFAQNPNPLDLGELVESFIGSPFAETTAMLTVIRALTPDQLLAARIGRALATRRHPMPDWLTGLDRASVEPQVWEMTHILGDGDDYLLGVTLPSGHRLAALIYVDYNMNGLVKDAFVVGQPLDEMVERMTALIEDPDQKLAPTDPSTARAILEQAIEVGAMTVPRVESDSWPASRPLVEWMLRMLPDGGSVPETKMWSKEELSNLANEFFASGHGSTLNGPDERDLLDSLLWFASEHGNGDPLRWSPVNVEIVLADWFPRKVLASRSLLAGLPDVLRAFVEYAHDRRGIRTALTRQTLAAIDAWEPEYKRQISSGRAAGLGSTLGGLLPPGEVDPREFGLDEFDIEELVLGPGRRIDNKRMMLDLLREEVGGHEELMQLDGVPLPDEAFRWDGIADDIRPVVKQMLESCDRCADELLDVEHRTAMRRFLARAAVGDPAAFRRKASAERGAAAVAWVICRANDTTGYRKPLQNQTLLAWFGVRGSASQRADPLLRANGVDPTRLFGATTLGRADLLTGAHRAAIIESRDKFLSWPG